MLRSFAMLSRVDPGFNSARLTTMKIALPEALYPKTEQRAAFLEQVLQRLNSTPGIRMAAATDRLPLSGEGNWGGINIVGRPVLDAAHAPSVEGRAVSADYFRTMGIPLLRGRDFSEADVHEGRRVTVIDKAMADQFWPDADPVGQHISSPYHPDNVSEIIGVVANVKDFALDSESAPVMYSPYRWWNVMNLIVSSAMPESALTAAVRSEVAAIDRQVPIYDVTTVDDVVSQSIARQRFELTLLALFAVVALVLAAVGVYGLLSFSVGRRTHEIGLRIALGAPPRRVLAAVVSQGLKLVLLGVALGTLMSSLLTGLLKGLLFQLSPSDPLTFATVASILTLVGTLACCIPARRAMQIDPMVALGSE